MILIISNIANDDAAALVDMFPPGAASLITASQFHQSFKGGFCVNDFSGSQIVLNDAVLPLSEISGVITTISNFFPQEFYYIEAGDRDYVCAELNAFFIYFLSELDCRKINPPSTRSLTGTIRHITEWIKIARLLNIPVWPVQVINGRGIGNEELSGTGAYLCTIVGNIVVQKALPETVYRNTLSLQKAFGMPYISCYYVDDGDGGYYLAEIGFVPDISSVANREAIVNYFS